MSALAERLDELTNHFKEKRLPRKTLSTVKATVERSMRSLRAFREWPDRSRMSWSEAFRLCAATAAVMDLALCTGAVIRTHKRGDMHVVDALVRLFGICMPVLRKHREAIVGDILEDISEWRSANWSEVRIALVLFIRLIVAFAHYVFTNLQSLWGVVSLFIRGVDAT
jgi:hypothetical protein